MSEHYDPFEITTAKATREPPVIRATPFALRDPLEIPRRQFIYGRHLIRRFLSTTVAAGGVGKSQLIITDAMAMVTGRNLTGDEPAGPLRVWLWNGEDPADELERRIAATALHYGIPAEQIAGRLFVDSGRDTPLILATQSRNGVEIAAPVVGAVIKAIRENQIDVFQVDPFVSSHSVTENDNGAIDAVAKTWNRIANETGCAIEMVHHLRKTGGNEATVEDGRGAVALLAAARSARVLNRMTKDEGEKAGVDNPNLIFRVGIGKSNLTAMQPPDKARWHELKPVDLGNGDSVGVVTSWQWPDPFAGVSVADLRKAQDAVAGGRWKEAANARAWVGKAIGDALGLDMKLKANRAKVSALLRRWMENGMFVVVEGKDDHRETKRFVEVGEWAS